MKNNHKEVIQVVPVILCGGSGTRLWPFSRTGLPKQFLVLSGLTSLFQQALARAVDLCAQDISIKNFLVVSGEEHRFLVLDQVRELEIKSISVLLEPVGRNTAPAITIAALESLSNCQDPVLVVMPSDHAIGKPEVFRQALQSCIRLASEGSIAVLGVPPTKPETGFGYIKYDTEVGCYGDRNVSQFTEKPNLETAKDYLTSGQYYWNSGVYVMRASVWLGALKKFRPDIFESSANAFEHRQKDNQLTRFDHVLFAEIPNESIDKTVIEQSPGSEFQIRMIPLECGWSDLGSWDAVWEAGTPDLDRNVLIGDVLTTDVTDTLVLADHRLVGAVGVTGLTIIETADAVLVADRSNSEGVRKIAESLRSSKRVESFSHRKVFRPWGWYDTLDFGERFKVKRILVNPDASLSLQKHNLRAEHWVVVKGIAEVICGNNTIMLRENESTFIPKGELHRIKNIGEDFLEIIEVQSGEYLGEDDIVRYEDNYNRL